MLDVVEEAENVIKDIVGIRKDSKKLPTTSQIRKFLSSVNVVLNKVNKEKREALKGKKSGNEKELLLSDKLVQEIKYLKINIAYDSGRDKKNARRNEKGNVELFFEKSGMVKKVDEIGNSIVNFEKFAKYVEALVAYHKFYGGRE